MKKKSSSDNSPYQNARTSLSEPKSRKTRTSAPRSGSSTRGTRSSSANEIYGSTSKPSSRGSSASSRRSADQGSSKESRRPYRSTQAADSKPSRKSPRPKASESSRSIAEDAEILRRFKSLMQQGNDNTNTPVASDPYPSYQIDELGNVIHQKGTSRPKSEVKVVVRRKRPLNSEDEELELENQAKLLDESPDQEYIDSDDELVESAQNTNPEEPDHYQSELMPSNDEQVDSQGKSRTRSTKSSKLQSAQESFLEPKSKRSKSANSTQELEDDDSNALAPGKRKRTSKAGNLEGEQAQLIETETSKSKSKKKGLAQENSEPLVSDESDTKSNKTEALDDNLLRAAAIIFAQDPVMGVSKEQSLALGITDSVAESILQEKNLGNKKKKNKLTPLQKAEAEAKAAAEAAAEAAAIVALSKQFSGRKVSQAERSLDVARIKAEQQTNNLGSNSAPMPNSYQATAPMNRAPIRPAPKNPSAINSQTALLNKLERTRAQLEKDDILPDSFGLYKQEELDESNFTRASTVDVYEDSPQVSKHNYSAKSVAEVDKEFDYDDSTPIKVTKRAPKSTVSKASKLKSAATKSSTTKRTTSKSSTSKASELESTATKSTTAKRTTSKSASSKVSETKSTEPQSQERLKEVETNSVILTGANDTTITIKVKRRKK